MNRYSNGNSIVEAVQFPGYKSRKPNWFFDIVDVTPWIENAYENDIIWNEGAVNSIMLKIRLPSGKYEIRPGDWIIYDASTSQVYYMDPELFAEKYKKVDQ